MSLSNDSDTPPPIKPLSDSVMVGENQRSGRRQKKSIHSNDKSTQRIHEEEQIASFIAFYIYGHDNSWAHVAPEIEEQYRHQAEALWLCAHGANSEDVAMGEPLERFDAPGCQMCGAPDGDPCDCHDPQADPLPGTDAASDERTRFLARWTSEGLCAQCGKNPADCACPDDALPGEKP